MSSEEKLNVTDADATNDDPEQHPSKGSVSEALKLDSKGLPLVPQPSHFEDDPLNWPAWLKWAVLLQVSFMAFLGPYNAALINPSLVLLSNAMGVNSKTAAYSTTTGIITGGISPFIWTPLANFYGRRPTTLLAILITILGGIGSGASPNFAALLGTRAMCGFGFGGMMSVGTSCVNDMFFLHERGEKTGVYSVFITNGAHVAALIGGFLGQSAGWRWDYYLGAISTSFSLLLAVFLFPETLFPRCPAHLALKTHERSYYELLFTFRTHGSLSASDFLNSFRMLRYPSVTIPFIYYTLSWMFINVLPAITLATIYTKFFHLKSGPIGACLGTSLIIGSLLGELFAGRASDYLIYRLSQRSPTHERKPEHRLYLTALSAIFMPLGMIIFGCTVSTSTSYVTPLVGLAIGVFGLQIASTCLYAYVSDCYKEQTPESGVLFNLGRGLSFIVGYFALPYADKVGFPGAWGTFAALLFLGWIPVAALCVWGERWRGRLGRPRFGAFL